jgi:hypothetical protein
MNVKWSQLNLRLYPSICTKIPTTATKVITWGWLVNIKNRHILTTCQKLLFQSACLTHCNRSQFEANISNKATRELESQLSPGVELSLMNSWHILTHCNRSQFEANISNYKATRELESQFSLGVELSLMNSWHILTHCNHSQFEANISNYKATRELVSIQSGGGTVLNEFMTY